MTFSREELNKYCLFRVCTSDEGTLFLSAVSRKTKRPVVLYTDSTLSDLYESPRTESLPESRFAIDAERAFNMLSDSQFSSV